jgi:hypothetical protein
MMSDIDTRVRWRAAHALRRLARLGAFEVIEAVVAEVNRSEEKAFRDPSAPFYFLAAKFWLAMALYRISAETPSALRSCKHTLLDLATSPDLPHVAICEHAKRALMELFSAGTLSLTAVERKRLTKINVPQAGISSGKRSYERSFNQMSEKEHRFKFDGLDTLRYWYEDILRMFPTVLQDEVLGKMTRRAFGWRGER